MFVARETELQAFDDALADRRTRGVALLGGSGIGKSALLNHWGTSVHQPETKPLMAAGTASASEIPFGALAHLFPEATGGTSGAGILQRAHLTLSELEATSSPIIVVDDAHLLDSTSATFLHQVLVRSGAFIAISAGRDSQLPDAITEIVHNDAISVIEMGPLTEPETALAARAILGGQLGPLAAAELNRLTGGNPRYLYWLIQDAVAQRTLTLTDGIWQLSGPLSPGAGVRRVFEEKLATLSLDDVRTLELIAIASPVSLTWLERIAPLSSLERVETAGLVWVDPGCPDSSTTVSSPLLAQVLRTQIPAARRRHFSRLLEEQEDLDEGITTQRSWRLEVGAVRDADGWLAATRRAIELGDYPTAERYARNAIEGGRAVDGGLLLAQALGGQGKGEAADLVLQDTYSRAEAEADVARTALARMRILLRGSPEREQALELGREALARLVSDDWRDEISAELALHTGLLGDYRDALKIGSRVLARGDASDRATVGTLVVATQGQVMLGRFDDALASVSRGLAVAPGVQAEMPEAEDMLTIARFQAELFSGRVFASVQTAGIGFRSAIERRSSPLVGLWGACVGAAEMFAGDLNSATESYCSATGLLMMADPWQSLPVTQCWRALAEAQRGAISTASRLMQEVEDEHLPGEFRVNALKARVRAWERAQLGDIAGAATDARTAGLSLAEHSHVVWGCLALHDAVRFGAPHAIVDELEELAEDVDGDLIVTMARHARGLADGDGSVLDEVMATFSDLGAVALAAESAAQGAELHSRAGDRKAAGRASMWASTLARSCTGLDTPAIRERVQYLTPREEEIARLAARGLTSKEIASELGISDRTVDNHLGSVYVKLSVGSREQLTEMLLQPISRE